QRHAPAAPRDREREIVVLEQAATVALVEATDGTEALARHRSAEEREHGNVDDLAGVRARVVGGEAAHAVELGVRRAELRFGVAARVGDRAEDSDRGIAIEVAD